MFVVVVLCFMSEIYLPSKADISLTHCDVLSFFERQDFGCDTFSKEGKLGESCFLPSTGGYNLY